MNRTTPALGLLMALALSACATMPPPSPIPVSCKVTLPSAPLFAFDHLPVGSDVFTQMKTLLADRQQRVDYERQLRAAAEACS